jgi:long-subunit fatty acid transport protein
MTNILETMLRVNDTSVGLDLSLPAWFRGGLRYRHLDAQGKELWDVEVDFVYEMWSVLENFDVSLGSDFEVVLGEDADPEPLEVNPIKLPKKYKDTYSIRLGSTVHLSDAFDVHGGAFFESAASSNAYTHLDFTASERLGLTAGLTYQSESYALSFAYGHIFQPTRTVSAEETQIYQVHPVSPCVPPYEENCHSSNPGKPPGVPAGAGTYESGFHVWSVGLTMFFGGGR